MINDWDLTQTNMGRLSRRQIEVAVLPIGAIEPHNRHLPYGQDFFHSTEVAKRCVRKAWEATKKVILLPGIPYGVDCNLMDFPFAMHINQSTLDALVGDIVRSLKHYGILKIVLLNGHGGNEFKALIRRLQFEEGVHIFLCNWWKVGEDQYDQIFENPDDHAGELETSVALHLYPELVELKNAGDGEGKKFRFKALRRGWVQTSRNFGKLNDHCAVGNPFKASAQKGQSYLNLVCDRISEFLTELAQSPADANFPYEQ
ncbi:MAG: creatininase family protein [Calditrichaeota bacterium]|nr:creatininase family protein [Calditrichota bacterium]